MFEENIEQSSILLMVEEDRFKKWKWSESFNPSQLGILTLEIRKSENRFNNLMARKIVKIVKKQIDVSLFKITIIGDYFCNF